VKRDSWKKTLSKLTTAWKNAMDYKRNQAVCGYGHVTNCQTCASNDEQWRYERVSEIGR